jgi:hypothetical protein
MRRRQLLAALGAGLALPLLPSLVGEGRAAPAPKTAKRFVFVFTSNGQQPAVWLPGEPEPGWTTRAKFVHDAPLAPYAGKDGLSRAVGPAFDPLLSKILLIRGLDYVNTPKSMGGHNPAAPLSGSLVSPRPTLDQILAASPKIYPTAPPVRSAHMLVKHVSQAETSVSVDASLNGIPHQTSVAAAYQQLFGDFVAPDDAGAKARAALKLDVLADLEGAYDRLRGHPRLGSADRHRLEDHRDFVADLRARLGAMGASCQKPAAVDDVLLDGEAAMDLAAELFIKMLVAAFVCDRTRVATLMLCPGTDLRFSHHALSHDACYDASLVPELAKINRHYGNQLAQLLTELDALVEDPTTGATYLDNTLVYWGNEDGCNGFDAHVPYNAPVLLAGATRFFDTGRYIDYRQVNADGDGNCIFYSYDGSPTCAPTDLRGRPYNSLLISIAQAMGLEPADYEATPGAGIGDYSGNLFDQWSIADGRTALPFLAK